jgi:hypothetical protein
MIDALTLCCVRRHLADESDTSLAFEHDVVSPRFSEHQP